MKAVMFLLAFAALHLLGLALATNHRGFAQYVRDTWLNPVHFTPRELRRIRRIRRRNGIEHPAFHHYVQAQDRFRNLRIMGALHAALGLAGVVGIAVSVVRR
ncbi:hypothetical protein FKN01_15545 [Streptomyces sp. 130]|uniref:hypothetical protein n=1 Tax=Streptomyces sp. 130 TaxID=2591006 RepID=UPI00117E4AC9|nr:hypothetical protein [Streptomyces sp. 130]TRV77507.1 hypothetical protein FKN01_15545 [Streptomyces sp. 130]